MFVKGHFWVAIRKFTVACLVKMSLKSLLKTKLDLQYELETGSALFDSEDKPINNLSMKSSLPELFSFLIQVSLNHYNTVHLENQAVSLNEYCLRYFQFFLSDEQEHKCIYDRVERTPSAVNATAVLERAMLHQALRKWTGRMFGALLREPQKRALRSNILA